MSQYIFSDLQEASFSFLDPNYQWTCTKSVMIHDPSPTDPKQYGVTYFYSESEYFTQKKKKKFWHSCFWKSYVRSFNVNE